MRRFTWIAADAAEGPYEPVLEDISVSDATAPFYRLQEAP